jgi:hypothetical protein
MPMSKGFGMPRAYPLHPVPHRGRSGLPALLLGLASTLLLSRVPAQEPTALPDGSRARLTPLAQTAAAAKPGFTRLPTAALTFTNVLSEVFALNNQILENGAGVALADVNADGRCDVYLCGSENDNALFLNLGNGSFTNVTAAARVACTGDFFDRRHLRRCRRRP